MDNLVLTRLAVEFNGALTGTVLDSLRQESGERFRLVFASSSRELALVVSLRPELPWIGSPAFRWDGPTWSPDPFTNGAVKALVGRKVAGVSKDPCDRMLRIEFGDGHAFVVELVRHRANLILLGSNGVIDAAFRRPKGLPERLEPGRPWEARTFPPGRLDPFTESPDTVDALLVARGREGVQPVEVLRHDILGVGPTAAELVVRESVATGLTPGTVLRSRLEDILRGDAEIVIEGPGDPRRASDRGAFPPAAFRLLPWRPSAPAEGAELFSCGLPSSTAGLFHESLERAELVRGRIAALGGILNAEIRRTRDAEEKVKVGVRSFANPDRFAKLGEALLAGLTVARRAGDTVLVPDPYDPGGTELAVPAPPGKPLPQVADDLFHRGRRARRGVAAAAERARFLALRVVRLEAVLALQERARTPDDATKLEEAMRAEGLAVGLARPTRASRAAALTATPKVEGVRMLTSADGWTILVGRTGRDNDRLTFKLAAPEDVWLHASGVPGAHVVIRNPEKRASVPETTLRQAARLAAWFSDLRSDGMVEVQWTRRKYVRRARGGPSGRVILKRFESVQVRPQAPSDGD